MMDDLDRIMAVMNAAFDPEYGEAWTRRQVEDALTLPGTHYLLAAADADQPAPGKPAAGFALSRLVMDEEELLLLAVHPDYRRAGLGSHLLTRFIDAAAARGARRVFLEMRDGNLAEMLYRKHGFSRVGLRKNYYQRGSGPPRDAITFALDLETLAGRSL